MMIPDKVGYGFTFGTIGIGILLLIVANKFLQQSGKQKLVRIGGGISLALGILAIIANLAVGTDVIRIVHVGSGTDTMKYFMFGSSSVTIEGKAFDLKGGKGTWIVNETKDLRAFVEVREYGAAASSPPSEISVGPNNVGLFGGGIDLIGPDNSPPSSVSSKSSSEIRSWLSWSPAIDGMDDVMDKIDDIPGTMPKTDLQKDIDKSIKDAVDKALKDLPKNE